MTKSIFDGSTLCKSSKGRRPEFLLEFRRYLLRADIGGKEALKLRKQWLLAYPAATGTSELIGPQTGHLVGIHSTLKASQLDCLITDNHNLKLGGSPAKGLAFPSRVDRELGYHLISVKHANGQIRSTPQQFVDQVYRQDGNRCLALSRNEDIQVEILLKGHRFFTELETALDNSREQLFITWLAEKAYNVETPKKSELLLF